MVSKVYIFLIFMVLILPSLGLTRYTRPLGSPRQKQDPVLAIYSGTMVVLKNKEIVSKTYIGLPL